MGAHLLLGHPMHELARRLVTLEEAFASRGRALREELGANTTPAGRFAVLDRFFLALLDAPRTPKPSVAWALRELERSRGATPVGLLADRLGFSWRHLSAGFREQVGVTPKVLARILRFEHTRELADVDGAVDWGYLALRCGYYDQSHMIRDFRQFAGVTPGQLGELRLPDGGGLRAEPATLSA